MYDPYGGMPYPSPEQLAAALMSSYQHGAPYDASAWTADQWGGNQWSSQEQAAAYQMSGYGANWAASGNEAGVGADAAANSAAAGNSAQQGQKIALAFFLDAAASAEGEVEAAETQQEIPEQGIISPSTLEPEQASAIDPLWDGPGGALPVWVSDYAGAGDGGLQGSEYMHNSEMNADTPARTARQAARQAYGEAIKTRRDYHVPQSGTHDNRGSRHDATPAKAARVAQQLRQLLDFYFEPFNLQHNRYLLDLVARKLGAPELLGPWLDETLLDFRFSFNDLKGLGRIAAAMGKLRPSQWETGDAGVLGNLKHLIWGAHGQLLLRRPPEVRCFIEDRNTCNSLHPEVVSAALRYLASAHEQRGQAPAKMVSVLSYALGDVLNDDSPKGQLSHGRLKRQLLLHNSDVICIQGLDPSTGGQAITQTLVDEGYAYTTAKIDIHDANTIFWDASRWELLVRIECGAALAIDLRPHEDQSVVLRVICARPVVPTTFREGLRSLFAGRSSEDGPLVVCADLTLLGGAEGAGICEELAPLRSVMAEVTGEELAAPLGTRLADGGMEGVVAGASGLNKLQRPDSVLFSGMAPIVVLSGHTKRYLTTLDAEELTQQFPAFRAPIVAAFDWHCNVASPLHAASEGSSPLDWEQQQNDDIGDPAEGDTD